MLRKFKSHKIVEGAKIVAIDKFDNPDKSGTTAASSYGAVLTVMTPDGEASIKVSPEYMNRHQPYAGGYFVRYEDGYQSFSPSEAFENGYTAMDNINPDKPLGDKAPTVTPEYVNSRIKSVEYFVLSGTTTICAITLDNYFTVRGDSACVYPENFDEQKGRDIAYDNAYEKLWPLFGFLLAERRAGVLPVHDVARICHEVNREYCQASGDDSQVPWHQAPEWQRESAIKGVAHLRAHPESTPEDSHKLWMAEKESKGWVYGEVKDPDSLTHPCMVPYDELPFDQRLKGSLFQAVVRATSP